MTDTNLPPGFCGAIADELERIAADLRKIEHVELPEPRLFQLDIQPDGSADADIISAVDAIGTALLGRKGEIDTSVNSKPWYAAKGDRGPIRVSIYRGLSKPDERDAELARLRAEVEQLRAQQSGLDYSRPADGDDPQQIGQREPLHTGAVTDEGLVDETADILAVLDMVIDTEAALEATLRRVKEEGE